MRPAWRPPLNKRYFHTTRKWTKADSAAVKQKLEAVRKRTRQGLRAAERKDL